MKTKKFLTSILIGVFIFTQTGTVLAIEGPAAPSAPTSPEITQVQPPTTPVAPSAPTLEQVQANDNEDQNQDDQIVENIPKEQEVYTTEDLNGTISNGNTGGDTTINSGEANSSSTTGNYANTNISGGTLEEPGASVTNAGNGSGSENTGSIESDSSTTTSQDNTAIVLNDIDQSSLSGENSASKNTGGDSIVNTGDANTTATLINGINTNLESITVSEFNIEGNHNGDYILDFAGNCVYGCASSSSVINSENGSESLSSGSIDQVNNQITFQNNDATLENNLTLSSNSGDNQTSYNTDGNSEINTGDANTGANLINFVNNNISGNVVIGVVNIFGDLIGDIVLTDSELGEVFGMLSSNDSNGSSSSNETNINVENTDETYQFNNLNLQNNLNLDATTGDNEAIKNTDGNTSINTGETSVDLNLFNIVNSNIVGGNWWLVLVNEAGQWVGRLIGAPDGANYAGSSGTEFIVDESGGITAVNSGNGSESTSIATINQTNTNTTVQENNASLVNNLNLSANTGGNEASHNTGGNSTITTGDARVIANIVNFVNNNIKGGNLLVTVVNVFGNWYGDFVTPGNEKEKQNSENQNPQEILNHKTKSQANEDNKAVVNNSFNTVMETEDLLEGIEIEEEKIISETKKITGFVTEFYDQETGNKKEGAQVAGVSKEIISNSNSPKRTVNLAWGILTLPIITGFVLKRRLIDKKGGEF